MKIDIDKIIIYIRSSIPFDLSSDEMDVNSNMQSLIVYGHIGVHMGSIEPKMNYCHNKRNLIELMMMRMRVCRPN